MKLTFAIRPESSWLKPFGSRLLLKRLGTRVSRGASLGHHQTFDGVEVVAVRTTYFKDVSEIEHAWNEQIHPFKVSPK